MTDFDFDELDKAVAGVLNTDEPTSAKDTPNKSVAQPQEDRSERPESRTSPVISTPVTPPAARRSSGRFMDVVHPSSDMRTASSARSSFTPPAPRSNETTGLDTPSAGSSMEAPDTASNTNVSAAADDAWARPLESPFLPDAKVEKRPLGDSHPTGEQSQGKNFEDELLLEEPDDLRLEATTMPDPIDFAAQSNALDTEVEDTGEDTIEKSSPDILEMPTTIEYNADEPAKVASSSDLIFEEPSYELRPTESPEPVEPSGPTSITQQYKEIPGAQQESGAIYDTENYHQPVIKAGKKHHGAWAVLWIIVLIILGAGAGVAFYLFVLPML